MEKTLRFCPQMTRVPILTRQDKSRNSCLINDRPLSVCQVLANKQTDCIVARLPDQQVYLHFRTFPTRSGRYRVTHTGPYAADEVNILYGLYSSADETDVYVTVTVDQNRISIELPELMLFHFYEPQQCIALSARLSGLIPA